MSEAIPIIEPDSLRQTPAGFELQVRFKWYRSLPLSCIEGLTLSVDGRPVQATAMRFGINGNDYRLEELAGKVDEFWFILDSAVLRVDEPGRVTAGKPHQLDVEFGMRAPYIGIGGGKFLTIINKQSTTQVAA